MIPVIDARILGKDYRITPTFRVVEAWEERFRRSEFIERIQDPRYSDVAWMFWCALRYGTDAQTDRDVPTYREIGEWVLQADNQRYAGDLAIRLHFAAYAPDRWEEIKKNLTPSLPEKTSTQEDGTV
jgi:hypothetical protein